MERRDLLKSLFAFIPLGLGFAGISHMGLKFITPTKSKRGFRRLYALNLVDLPINESKPTRDLKGKDLVIIRTGEREVKALSTVCTHLGCAVFWQKDNKRFYCPCHEGAFDADGKVIQGPPPRDLDSYQVELEGDNVYIYFKENEA